VKRLVFRSITDESTRAAALKAGEVDIVYLLSGPTAQEIKRTPGLQLVAARPPGVPYLDLPEQWDPKSHGTTGAFGSPRATRSTARDSTRPRRSGSRARPAPSFRALLEFSRAYEPPPYDPALAKKLLAEAGYAHGFDAGDLTPFPPYFSMGEALVNYLQAVGIRTRLRTMERAAFLTAWREKKLRGVIMGLGAPAATRPPASRPTWSKNGIYSSGVVPEIEDLFQRQARELDRKKARGPAAPDPGDHARARDARAHLRAGFLWGVGPRVEEAGVDRIKGFSYSAPYEDLKLKPGR